MVLELTGSPSRIEYQPLPVDDPTRRCPVIDRARERLQWSPRIGIEEGLRRTIAWLARQPSDGCSAAPRRVGTLLQGAGPGLPTPAAG